MHLKFLPHRTIEHTTGWGVYLGLFRRDFLTQIEYPGYGHRFNLIVGFLRRDLDENQGRWRWRLRAQVETLPAWAEEPTVFHQWREGDSVAPARPLKSNLSSLEVLYTLVEAVSKYQMTPEEEREQRRSWAYGNTKIENDLVTRSMVTAAEVRIDEERIANS